MDLRFHGDAKVRMIHKQKIYKEQSLFGRRQGRTLGDMRQSALDDVLPKIKLPESKLKPDHSTNPNEFFDKSHKQYWLEIGFGHGEHVSALMRQNPDTGYLAAEAFVNGMSAFLHDIKDDRLDNIRAIMDDAMIIARSLAPNSLDGIYLLNPDPWHKKRHHKRRIINQKNLDIFAKILKSGGKLIMTSDVENVSEWMCAHASNHPEFIWQAGCKDDWQIPPDDWITTRYEIKGAKGAKKMVYLFFERR